MIHAIVEDSDREHVNCDEGLIRNRNTVDRLRGILLSVLIVYADADTIFSSLFRRGDLCVDTSGKSGSTRLREKPLVKLVPVLGLQALAEETLAM